MLGQLDDVLHPAGMGPIPGSARAESFQRPTCRTSADVTKSILVFLSGHPAAGDRAPILGEEMWPVDMQEVVQAILPLSG
jgi:hypothetical protein